MKMASLVAIATTAMWTCGCAHGVSRHAIATRGVAPSTYVTFFVLEGSSPDPRDQDLKADIVTALADRGLVETPPEDAQAVVVINTATPANHTRDAFYNGWGGWEWRIGDPGTSGGTENYKVRTLVIDIFDAWNKKLVWHGAALLPEASRAGSAGHASQKTVSEIFKDFLTLTPTALRPDTVMRIIFSHEPALLVRVDGEPRYEDVAGTSLQRVTNTEALILREESGTHYMRLGDGWMEAYDLMGSWSRAGSVPEEADIALATLPRGRRGELLETAHIDDSSPVVYVATTPTALVVTDGEPEYTPVRNTSLLYLRNTRASVFKEPTDKELYVRLPSGWFRSWTTNGPWQQIPEGALPADLASLRTLPAGGS